MQKLAELTSGDMLSSGIFPSLTATAPPLWADGENVIFDNLGVRKNYGLLGLANLSDSPTGLTSTYADNEARAFIGGGSTARIYRSGSGLTTIGTFAAAAGSFQFVPWDTWCLINNTVDPIELWKNTGSSAVIAGIPFSRANVIFTMGLRAFAGGTNNGGGLLEWCSFNNIEDWLPTITNSAGNLPLRQLTGDIVAAKPIGDSMGIYSNFNAGVFTQIGTGAYGFRRPIRGPLAISANSVVSLGDRHFGITHDNAFVTDLVSFQYIDEPAMRKYLLDNMDRSRASEVYGWPDYANSIIRWNIPKITGGIFGIGFRWDKGTWTRFNDSVILGEASGAFEHMFLAKSNRLLRQDKAQYDNDGTAQPSSLTSKPLDFGDRNRFKRIQKISLDGSWSGNARLKIGYSNHPNETPTWVHDEALANEINPETINTQSEGVFVTLKIESTAAAVNWNLSGAVIYGEVTGLVS